MAYVSGSLSEVERKYSQTEREALAIVWAMKRLQIYLCGGKFTLYTDCKPIELIRKPAVQTSCMHRTLELKKSGL
jgi:hypothetical protein